MQCTLRTCHKIKSSQTTFDLLRIIGVQYPQKASNPPLSGEVKDFLALALRNQYALAISMRKFLQDFTSMSIDFFPVNPRTSIYYCRGISIKVVKGFIIISPFIKRRHDVHLATCYIPQLRRKYNCTRTLKQVSQYDSVYSPLKKVSCHLPFCHCYSTDIQCNGQGVKTSICNRPCTSRKRLSETAKMPPRQM